MCDAVNFCWSSAKDLDVATRDRYWDVLQNERRQTGTSPDMQKGWFVLVWPSFVQECLSAMT